MDKRKEIFEQVKTCIEKCTTSANEDKIVPRASLKDDLDLDSLDVIELSMMLETEFKIQPEFQQWEIRDWKNVDDVVETVLSRIKR